tara:strand:+ start:7949 stop:10192 length:2244 start_codon:yes stop_codon:yes gene_type:complete
MARKPTNVGEQSGIDSVVNPTDQIHDNIAEGRIAEADPRQMGPYVDPEVALENARIDLIKDAVNEQTAYDELDRTGPIYDQALVDELNAEDEDPVTQVRVEVETPTVLPDQQGPEAVGNALNRDDNAAEWLDQETERKLVDYARAHFDLSYDRISDRYQYWRDSEVTHDIYVPASIVERSNSSQRSFNTGSMSQAEASGRYSKGKTKVIDSIKTPYSRAISDTICTYNLAIFGGAPPFKLESSGPDDQRRAAKILEHQLHRNMRKVGYEQRLYQIFLDNNRYGMSPVACFYGVDGNVPVNIDPWAYFPDPRVTSQNRHEAEFVGYRSWASRTTLHRRNHYQNLDRLEQNRPSTSWRSNSYLKEVIRGQSIDPALASASEELSGAGSKIGYAHILNTLYVYCDPRRFNIPAPFGLYRIVIADETVIIQFDKSPYPHDQIPVIHGEANYDAHRTFATSLYDLLMPLQRYQDWLLRTRVENVQSIVQNRLVVDPNRVNIRDILDPNAARLIRTLPGSNPSEALMPLTIPDATRNYWQDMDTAGQLMQRVAAASDTAQGIQAETQRTATEIARLTSLGQQRLGMQARLLSASTMRPLVRQMVSNLQYFQIDGGTVSLQEEVTPENPQGMVSYNRSEILGDFDYVVVDGTLPTSPEENSENITRAIRVLTETGASQGWDMSKFVERLIESFGFSDVENWKAAPQQMMPDEQIQQELAAGNILPMQQAQQEMGIGQPPIGPEPDLAAPAEVMP